MSGLQNKEKYYPIKQYNFCLKTNRDDGLILQIHHTNSNGKKVERFRFTRLHFHPSLDQLCSADQTGNIFIVDFSLSKYWILANFVQTTFVAFIPTKKNLILVGLTTREVQVINTSTGQIIAALKGHKTNPKYFSFSSDQYFLTASEKEAIIWDAFSYSKVHELSLANAFKIKYIAFIPITNNILCCFDNDEMHIWQYKTFDQLQRILPATWKGRDLKSITFTKNGRGMVLGGRFESLAIFATDTWSLDRIIELPDTIKSIRHIQFIPEIFDGGANKILGILCSKFSFHIYDIEENFLLKQSIDPLSGIYTFESSWDGRYLACILQTGEINIYLTKKFLDQNQEIRKIKPTLTPPKRKLRNPLKTEQCKEYLSKKRLVPILKQFGEYPENYRILIWKSILKTPGNQKAFTSLVDRGCDPAFSKLKEIYPLENKLSLINLQRMLSLLASWCPLFSQTKCLPLFVYPFVKILHNNPLLCFEIITTIILNFCQFWYQYFPFPPMNIMGIIENILSTNDPVLLKHLNTHCITSELYAWTLLETAFSEVLSQKEWLKLWDHIISNEPSFLLIATVSYNITNRTTILSCTSSKEFHHFYHNQNSIDMKKFLAKTYSIIENLNPEFHPRQYLKDFEPLQSGAYPVFVDYPKNAIDYQAKEMEEYHKQEEKLRQQEFEAAEMRAAQLVKYKEQIKALEHDTRLKSLGDIYKKTLSDEEKRLEQRRKNVAELNAMLQKKEETILENDYDRFLLKNYSDKKQALEQALDEISRQRDLEQGEDVAFKNSLTEYATKLICQKNQMEMMLWSSDRPHIPRPNHLVLKKRHESLTQEMKKVKHKSRTFTDQLAVASRIAAVDNVLHDIEIELASEMAQKQENNIKNQNNLKIKKLEQIIQQLEGYVKVLLEKIAKARLDEATHCHNMLFECVNDQEANAQHDDLSSHFYDERYQESDIGSSDEILTGRKARPSSPVTMCSCSPQTL